MKIKFLPKAGIIFILSFLIMMGEAGAQKFNRRTLVRNTVKPYLGIDLHYGYSFSGFSYNHSYNELDVMGNVVGGQKISNKYNVTGTAMGLGVYFPLAALTERSIFTINVGVDYNSYKYAPGEIKTSPTSSFNYDIASTQIAIPISVDYKLGGEAIQDKSEDYSVTLGVGLSPTFNSTKLGPVSESSKAIRPFVHGDIGFFLGVAWRFSAAYYFGAPKLMEINSQTPGVSGSNLPPDSKIYINGAPMINLSLGVYPLSFFWKRNY